MIRFDNPTTESVRKYLGSKTITRTWEAKVVPGESHHHEFKSEYARSPGHSETVVTEMSVRRVCRQSPEDGAGHGQEVDELQISIVVDTLYPSGRTVAKHASLSLRGDQLAHFLRACTERQG